MVSTILIVDDEPSARETFTAMLDGQDYQIELAKDGYEALEIAEQIMPDLILLDVMMPGMDGFEVCRRIRSTPDLAEVPVVMLTALDNHTSLVSGIEAGADDFLSKPIERQELVARVQTITRLNRYRTLMEQRESLRAMVRRVIDTQEEERKRLSREMHDELGQALTVHLLDLRHVQKEFSGPDDELFDLLQSLYDQTSEIFSTIHRLVKDLRPPALDTLGLVPAMKTYCLEFTRRTKLPVIFEFDKELPKLQDVYNITLYRALQESLTNIIKHAQATQAWVELSIENDDTITLTVQDNGRGFVYDKLQSDGVGLSGLRERLTLVGGNLTVTTKPQKGTILTACLPLVDEHAVRGAA